MQKLAVIAVAINGSYYFFRKWAKLGPFFVYFRPFLNTMPNIVQNLTINGRDIDGVIGFEPGTSVTRLDDFLHFGQLFKAFGNY